MNGQDNPNAYDSHMQNIFASSLAASRAKAKKKWHVEGQEDDIASSIMQGIDTARGLGGEFKKQAKMKAFGMLKSLIGL